MHLLSTRVRIWLTNPLLGGSVVQSLAPAACRGVLGQDNEPQLVSVCVLWIGSAVSLLMSMAWQPLPSVYKCVAL